MNAPFLIAIMGPTAAGKTSVAEALADHLHAVLLNADAFQVYRGMDIGTAKSPRKDEYELVDLKDPNESFGVGEWLDLAHERLQTHFESGRDVVLVGGTGLYVRALTEGYAEMSPAPDPDVREQLNALSLEVLVERLSTEAPELAARVDLKNRARVQRALERKQSSQVMPSRRLPDFRVRKFAVDPGVDQTRANAAVRVGEMIESGWVDEVQKLRDAGFKRDDPGLRAHGYRHIWDVLEATMELAQAVDLTIGDVRRYARRQRTWLRREPGLIRLEPNDPLRDAMSQLH